MAFGQTFTAMKSRVKSPKYSVSACQGGDLVFWGKIKANASRMPAAAAALVSELKLIIKTRQSTPAKNKSRLHGPPA
jgi:hypothetical protein